MICQKVTELKAKISAACREIERDSEEIVLVGASKYATADEILQAADCSIKVFGENRVQDFLKKRETVGNKVDWHFIGHLQTNKVKYLVGVVKLIQSVDSVKLAQAINKEAMKKGVIQPVLTEVNVAKEPTKYGFSLDEIQAVLKEVSTLTSIRVLGLMTIAPLLSDPEELRPYFRRMKNIFDRLKTELKYGNIEMKYLSMGMTNDYQVAVGEGSNMLRIGSAIFR